MFNWVELSSFYMICHFFSGFDQVLSLFFPFIEHLAEHSSLAAAAEDIIQEAIY